MALSHDNGTLFSIGDGYNAIDVSSGNILLSGRRDYVEELPWASGFSSDMVVMGATDHLEVWNIHDGTRYAIIPNPGSMGENFKKASFSADGSFLAYSRDGARVHIWNVSSKSDQTVLSSASEFTDISWHPVQPILAYVDSTDVIRFYDATNRTTLPVAQVPNGRCRTVVWSPGGDLVCCGLWGSYELKIIDFHQRRVIRTISGWNGARSIAYSPDGGMMIVPTDDRNISIIETSNWNVIRSVETGERVLRCSWGPSNYSVMTASYRGIELWWVRNWTRVGTIDYFNSHVEFGSDDLEILCVGQGVVRFKAPYAMYSVDYPSGLDEDTSASMRVILHGTNHPLVFSWDMGDGTGMEGMEVEHAWDTPGSYTIRVAATNDRGFTTILELPVIVNDITPPVARITGPTDVNEDLRVSFSANASSDNYGIDSYLWVIENKTVYRSIYIDHVFAQPGVFTVQLTVRDLVGLENDIVISITVHDITPPYVVEDLSDELATTGDVYTARVQVEDNVDVASVNSTKPWAPVDVDENGNGIYEFEIPIEPDYVGRLDLGITVTDTSGNEAYFGLQSREVVDNDPPSLVEDLTPGEGIKGLTLTFSARFDDNVWMEAVYTEYRYGIGPVMNESATAGDNYQLEITTPRRPSGPLEYRFLAVDGRGNWAATAWSTVTLVNAPPTVTDIPTWVVVEEQEGTLDLSPYIRDGNDRTLDISCDDEDITIAGYTLSILAMDWVPDRTITVTVSDGEDSADATILLRVQNVNDPPGVPEITSPSDGDRFEKGKEVRFDVVFDDPDLEVGQVLTVIWTSNRDGELGRFTSDDAMEISKTGLGVGVHTITVTVDDGEETSSTSLEITVFDDEVNAEGISTPVLAIIVGVALVIIAVLGYTFWTRKRNA